MMKEKRSKIMYCEKITNEKTNKRRSLFVWGFVLITLIVTTAVGANAPAEEPPQIIDKFEVEVDFGVKKALAMLGDLCGKNIVPSPNVDGVLAFRSLKNVTFEEAMDAILGENFKYEQEGKLIKVYTRDEYKKMKEDPARMTHKVITLYYITAEEAAKLITPVLSDSAKIEQSTAAEVDISGGTGGGSGGSSSGSSGSSGGSLGSGGGGNKLAINDTIVVYDFPEKIEEAEKVIKKLDIKPKQVLIEATILSALLDEDSELGIDWNTMGGWAVDSVAAIDLNIGAPIQTAGFGSPPGGKGLTVGVRSDDVYAFITALESVTDTTVLANPKILTVNKQQGSLLIGKRLGYNSQTTTTDGGTTSTSVEFYESGTRLVFRPYIGNDGYIRMEIYPKDSSAEVNPATGAPDETTTELQANIIVKDGETIVLGGLFRNVVTTTRSQVPILGDIPIVGLLFRGQVDLTQREEVIVMLTPHIIEEPEETNAVMAKADVARKSLGAKEEELPISRRKMTEDAYARAARFYIQGDNESAMKELKIALTLRPSYLEAIRLKEKIIAEVSPQEAQMLDRIVLDKVENEVTGK
jgi:type IV pilus assembly protein PilQ